MVRELLLPADFEDYAWEVEAKGILLDARVSIDNREVAITFYDPVRLAQDINDDLASDAIAPLLRVLVVREVTVEAMRHAVTAAPASFFA